MLDDLEALIDLPLHSPWMTLDQPMIDRFAEVTRDRQFIHIDPIRAAATAFGGTIVHGFLTLSLLPHLHDTIPEAAAYARAMAVNYGFDRLRFVSPVRSGAQIRLRSTLIAIEEKRPGRFQLTRDIVVEIEAQDRPAMTATWLTQIIAKS